MKPRPIWCQAAVAGAHKDVLQKEVDVQGVWSGAHTDLCAHLGQLNWTQNPTRSTFVRRDLRCSRVRVPRFIPSPAGTPYQPPCPHQGVLQAGPAACFLPRHERPGSFAGCFTAVGREQRAQKIFIKDFQAAGKSRVMINYQKEGHRNG